MTTRLGGTHHMLANVASTLQGAGPTPNLANQGVRIVALTRWEPHVCGVWIGVYHWDHTK